MAKVVWKITKDFTADKTYPEGTNSNAVGVWGPNGSDPTQDMPDKFRMLDDDGELVYEGVTNAMTIHLRGGNADCFEPLDHFGEGNAGCTRIDYFTNGKWEGI